MDRNISLFIVLFMAFLSALDALCVPTNNANVTVLNSALLTPTRVITFDDIPVQAPWVSQPYANSFQVSSSPNQSAVLFAQGDYAQCAINNYANYSPWAWMGGSYWSGSTTERVGNFLQGVQGSPANSICTLQFIPPISAFVARINTINWANWLTIYDSNSQPLDCFSLPTVLGVNTYTEIGFSSDVPIGYINFFMAGASQIYFVDNIQYITCDSGFKFNRTDMTCYDIDECLDSPCGDHASCTNTNGSFVCSCNDGYEQNNGTCVEIDRCTTLSPCSTFATCTNINGSFTCTCNQGYEGDGVGQNGCQQTVTPSDNSNNTPSSSNTPGSTTPNKSNSPSSSIVSSSHIATAVNSMLLLVTLLLIVAT